MTSTSTEDDSRLAQLLDEARRHDPLGSSSRAADDEALELLQSTGDPGALLGSLALEALARLSERLMERLCSDGEQPERRDRSRAWDLLDLLARSDVLCRLASEDLDGWARRLLRLVESSHLTFGELFSRRAETYAGKTLFLFPERLGRRPMTWRQVAARVDHLARGLQALLAERGSSPVAILSENRLEMALTDLACLSSGIVNVLIPATGTAAEVGYILKHAGAGVVVVSGREQLEKVLSQRQTLHQLHTIISMDADPVGGRDVLTLSGLEAKAASFSPAEAAQRRERVRIGDLATVMYTSGTTGRPKGIMFSHRNIVYKRFARALALPEIGDRDHFLCYLPLFHTFGRFLELTGCIFWGATYCWLDDPSIEGLASGMRQRRPSVFISIPKKWIELYEMICRRVDVVSGTDEEIGEVVRRITGGRLRWGLSAAGFLDPEIFRFFQRHGVHLMSGFGMTEATGGITMTPPGRYKEDSLGRALPGVEVRLAEDGELQVRGPYVMMGYLDPPNGEPSFDDEGWLSTGDLMEMDSEGFIRLIDRKKEIYKNDKGETIAPQKIENLFRDFDSVGRVFLVGDHRPYNTALIYPNPEDESLSQETLTSGELMVHFRSLVASVNKFLSPYERIVDFALMDRDLDPERKELTPKGTYRRKEVERSFSETIAGLYRRTDLEVGGARVTFPNWLFQALGITAQDLEVGEDAIRLPSTGRSLSICLHEDGSIQVGSALYSLRKKAFDLGRLLTIPALWLGNGDLVEFAELQPEQRVRPVRRPPELTWSRPAGPFGANEGHRESLWEVLRRGEPDLHDIHLAAMMVAAPAEEDAFLGIRVLESLVAGEEGHHREVARKILIRCAGDCRLEVKRRSFQVLAVAERPQRYRKTLDKFLAGPGLLLDSETIQELAEHHLVPIKVDALVDVTETASLAAASPEEMERASSLLRFLAAYGAAHPTSFRRLRAPLVRLSLEAPSEEVREVARMAAETLRGGFRRWIGPPSRIAVDPETGREYRWEDVVSFEEGVPRDDRKRLLRALKGTPLLRESIFLFSRGGIVRLSDIPPGGVWIRLLGKHHGKSVYRVTVQTRHEGSHDLAVNLNESLAHREVQEEISWLILCGETREHGPVVEDFGGYWPEFDLWTEEFIAGDTLDRVLRRLTRREKDKERFANLWPFFAWKAMAIYLEFWNRTGRRMEIADPDAKNIIVPTHDYQTGARLISISSRKEHQSLLETLTTLRTQLVDRTEERYPAIAGLVGWDMVFSSLLEAVGEEEGLELLEAVRAEAGEALEAYMEAIRRRGFLPLNLYFARKRYRRWERLGTEPTEEARARTISDIYTTYGIHRILPSHPEARVRFFRDTVFRQAPEPLAQGLDDIIARLRSRELLPDEVRDAVTDLRAGLELDPQDDSFLARLSFPYLRPEDDAGFISSDLSGTHLTDMVVTQEDLDGIPFRIRHALNPKEVGRLHRLFSRAKLDVRFRPEHQFLVALNDRGHLVGGLFYELEEGGETAYMDKIVVAEGYRRKGVAKGLLDELCNRLQTAGYESLTTGFFRPEFFYSHGFTIERRYAGLVRDLRAEEQEDSAGLNGPLQTSDSP